MNKEKQTPVTNFIGSKSIFEDHNFVNNFLSSKTLRLKSCCEKLFRSVLVMLFDLVKILKNIKYYSLQHTEYDFCVLEKWE